MQKGRSKVVIVVSFSGWVASSVAYFVFGVTILVNVAKSFFCYVAVKVYKIDQKGSKGAPGTARVVLVGISRPPRVRSGRVRGGKPIYRIIDQKHVY